MPTSAFRAAAAAALLFSAATAQGRHVFVIDSALSSFTYTGNVSVPGIGGGPIVGQPNTFNISGSAAVDVTAGGSLLTGGELVNGNGAVVSVPTLNAIIPNIFPFLPPLATISVTNLQFIARSTDSMGSQAPFLVQPNGSFSTNFVAELTSGLASVSGLVNQTVPLAGILSNPAPASGQLLVDPDGLRLVLPVNSTFSFTDPGTGAVGALTLTGQLVATDQAFAADVPTISLATGGTQTMTASVGTAGAGNLFFVLGSLTGTSPGTPLGGGFVLPLNFDGYTATTLRPNSGTLTNSLGLFSAAGIGATAFAVPPLDPALVGLTFNHAFAELNPSGTIVGVSNPVELQFAP